MCANYYPNYAPRNGVYGTNGLGNFGGACFGIDYGKLIEPGPVSGEGAVGSSHMTGKTMSTRDIDLLKTALSRFAMGGGILQSEEPFLTGSIVGISFHPYWTRPDDTRIDKIEIDILDRCGKIVPMYLNQVTGYEIFANDGKGLEKTNNAGLDIWLNPVCGPGSVLTEERVHFKLLR